MAHTLTELQEWALEFTCPYCGQPPGEFCVTFRGRFVGTEAIPPVHAARQDIPWQIWRTGWRGGCQLTRDAIVHDLKRWADEGVDPQFGADLRWAAARIEESAR